MERKSELERKKAKLAAIREEKRRKEEEKTLGTPSGDRGSPVQPDLRQETEDILKTLGIDSASPALSQSPVPSVGGKVGEKDGPQMALNSSAVNSPRRVRKLQISQTNQTSIPPKENVVYCKETQTRKEEPPEKEILSYDEANRDDDIDANATLAELQKMPHVGLLAQEKIPEELPIRELSENEKLDILGSEDFVRFFSRSATLIERAVAEPCDIFTNYAGRNGEEEMSSQDKRQLVKVNREFFDDRWSRHRTVTCLDWSPIYPELLAASYTTNEEAPHEPDGVCLVWNTKYKKPTPEFIFHCQSPVMSTCFAKFHPNLVIGGTYSGQIVLWDSRTNKRTPVQRTLLSTTAHTHPVYSVTVAGTQNAHNLISISSDGKMCAWSLDMLTQPQESRDLQYRQAKSVAASCFAFFANDVNNYVVGSEEGAVYSGCRHGNKAGLADAFEAHQGPVTGLDTHTNPGPIDFSVLFLTSSIDWTVKLWSVRDSKPLYSFEDNNDYVYDVQWSPIHPAVFAAVDGEGRLDVWNINSDTEVPTARYQIDSQTAFNKLRWHSSGQSIAVGDAYGRIQIFDINEVLSTPGSEEWANLAHTIGELKTSATERDSDLAVI